MKPTTTDMKTFRPFGHPCDKAQTDNGDSCTSDIFLNVEDISFEVALADSVSHI
jgi:hypothetical protein